MTPPAWTWRVPFDWHPPCVNLLDRIRRRVGMMIPSRIGLCSCLHSWEQPIRVYSCPPTPLGEPPMPFWNVIIPPTPKSPSKSTMATDDVPGVAAGESKTDDADLSPSRERAHTHPLLSIGVDLNPPSRHDRAARGVGTSGQKHGPP